MLTENKVEKFREYCLAKLEGTAGTEELNTESNEGLLRRLADLNIIR